MPDSVPAIMLPSSLPHVADVSLITGSEAPDGQLDLLIEIPHGATEPGDYNELASQLRSPLPENLEAFYYVNTDVGAPELAVETARLLVAARPTLRVGIVRCRIPRTFIDCNRRIDAAPEEFKAGRVTPGLMPWVTDAADRELLLERYHAYLAVVQQAVGALTPHGQTLLLHTYAPRTVDVEVDHDIVTNLRQAYEPGRLESFPLRPELDVIARDINGQLHADPALQKQIEPLLADTHRLAHRLYKPDDLARSKTTTTYRAKNPAANAAAEAIILYPTNRPAGKGF